MAIDFPTSPVNGQIFGTHTYDSSVPGWRKTPETASGLPAGTIVQWPGATAPANWMIADGSAISRTTYASLFAAIGVQYGVGDGSTTFNLPDLKGRVVAGLDSSQVEFNTLGELGGVKTHTLTTAEIPSHTHTFSGTTTTDGAHTHTFGANQNGVLTHATGGGGYSAGFTNQGAGEMLFYRTMDTGAGTHSHTYSGTTASAGTGGAHNNLQPYIVLNYIIKLSAGITAGDSELATRVGAIETTTVRSVPLGGTGASTLTSGSYLKGAGTSAITAQSGIPAGDITSGVLVAARLPSTSIVQTVVGTYAGGEIGNSTGTFADTGLTATITPTSSTSKILILISQALLKNSNTSVAVNYKLLRGATDLGNLGSGMLQTASSSEWNGMQSFYYQDTPATGSAVTYKTQFASSNGGPVVVANRGAVAYMILMEVKA